MDPATIAMIMQGMQNFGGGLGGVLGGLFNNSGRPYQKASDAYGQGFGQAQQSQQPFYNAGVNSIGTYQDWLNKMSNPSGFVNNLMSGYQESPWAKFQTDQALRASNNQASAEGLIGSTPLAQRNADYARNISSQDMGNWMDRVLGVNTQYGQGVNNVMTGGQNAANNISNLQSMLAQLQGGAAFGQAQGEQKDRSGIIGGLLKMFMG
jgi:hypothetical protein